VDRTQLERLCEGALSVEEVAVVESPAADSGIDRGAETLPGRFWGEREPGGREAPREPSQNDRWGEPLTVRHSAQIGGGLERHVGDQRGLVGGQRGGCSLMRDVPAAAAIVTRRARDP
jgi:hypothetical protein